MRRAVKGGSSGGLRALAFDQEAVMNQRILHFGVIAALTAIVIGVAMTPRPAENRPHGMDNATFITNAADAPTSPAWEAF